LQPGTVLVNPAWQERELIIGERTAQVRSLLATRLQAAWDGRSDYHTRSFGDPHYAEYGNPVTHLLVDVGDDSPVAVDAQPQDAPGEFGFSLRISRAPGGARVLTE
jgi:hypothetical protein